MHLSTSTILEIVYTGVIRTQDQSKDFARVPDRIIGWTPN